MSIEAIKWAVELAPPMPAQLVATLIGLANHADTKGRGSYPSLPTLAAYTCKSDRSVRRDLRELETLGLIRPGDPAKTAHLPADKRPEVYDLALEKTVPDGRAGKSEETRTSGRTLVSSRARGGRKKSSSEDMREDVDVRGDVDVRPGRGRHDRADVDVTTDRTWASAKPSVEPSGESLSSRVPHQTRDSPAAPGDEREIDSHDQDGRKVAAAWSAIHGVPNPVAEKGIAAEADQLLAAGWSIPDLVALAEHLARTKPTFTKLGPHIPHWQASRCGTRPTVAYKAPTF